MQRCLAQSLASPVVSIKCRNQQGTNQPIHLPSTFLTSPCKRALLRYVKGKDREGKEKRNGKEKQRRNTCTGLERIARISIRKFQRSSNQIASNPMLLLRSELIESNVALLLKLNYNGWVRSPGYVLNAVDSSFAANCTVRDGRLYSLPPPHTQ